MKPVQYDLFFYRNSDFKFEFRIKSDNSTLDLTGYTVVFSASDGAGGTNVFTHSSGDSPVIVLIDESEDYLVTILMKAVEIDGISQEKLFYTIDLIDPENFDQRYIHGNILIQNGAD